MLTIVAEENKTHAAGIAQVIQKYLEKVSVASISTAVLV